MYLQGANIHRGEFRVITNQTIQNGEFAFRSILNQQKLKSVGFNRVGIQALSQAVSHGAMHDSTERDLSPRCHPGTRERPTEDIICWIEEPIHPPLFSGLAAAREWGNQRSCRGSQNSKGYISAAAFSSGGAHLDAT
jgi:hypothetical protein